MLSPIIQLINAVAYVVGLIIPILIGVALIFFFWGLIQYIRNAGKKGHERGRKTMIAGITALFIMVSIWGIIAFLQSSLGIRGNAPEHPPYVPLYSGSGVPR